MSKSLLSDVVITDLVSVDGVLHYVHPALKRCLQNRHKSYRQSNTVKLSYYSVTFC